MKTDLGHYDRQGKPLTLWQWANLTERRDPAYKRVAETTVGKTWVSTVWIGMDMGFRSEDPPLIFETMVFGGVMDQETWRWATEESALRGHEEVVTMVRLERMVMTHGQVKHERDLYRQRMKRKARRIVTA